MESILVVDSGGRGNVIVHVYERSPNVSEVYVAPGNAGSSLLPKCRQLPIKQIDEILDYAIEHSIGQIFVGPEGYLRNGIVNSAYARNFKRIIGPTKEAGILEEEMRKINFRGIRYREDIGLFCCG